MKTDLITKINDMNALYRKATVTPKMNSRQNSRDESWNERAEMKPQRYTTDAQTAEQTHF